MSKEPSGVAKTVRIIKLLSQLQEEVMANLDACPPSVREIAIKVDDERRPTTGDDALGPEASGGSA